MNFGILAKRAGMVAADNSPAILTTIGVAGALTTVFLTGKATLKAADILEEELRAKREHFEEPRLELTFQQKAHLVWKEYIPAACVGVVSIACLIAANRIGARRVAALASAYALAEKAAVQYKDKVIETLGKKKEGAIRDAMAQDEINAYPIDQSVNVIVPDAGGDLFRDSWSGRYFNSTVDRLEKARNEINHQLNTAFYASLSDFYDLIGLDHTEESDEIGWNPEQLLDLTFSWASTRDDRPCGVVRFSARPVRSYTSFR